MAELVEALYYRRHHHRRRHPEGLPLAANRSPSAYSTKKMYKEQNLIRVLEPAKPWATEPTSAAKDGDLE